VRKIEVMIKRENIMYLNRKALFGKGLNLLKIVLEKLMVLMEKIKDIMSGIIHIMILRYMIVDEGI
jgi:hypothetical protein